jgi:hypothetical protein
MSKRIPVPDPQQPAPVTVEPGAVYAQMIEKKIDDAQRLMYYVVVILLVMVATIVIMVALDWKNSNNRVLDRIDSMERAIYTVGTTSAALFETEMSRFEPVQGYKVWGSDDYYLVERNGI